MTTSLKILLVCAAAAAVVLPVAAVAADGEAPRARKWGLGWDQGLTLRRWVADWELGVTAGPDDWLDERTTRVWDTAESDSLQGRDDGGTDYRRESGFVRLGVGRVVAREAPLDFLAQVGLRYLWSNERRDRTYYNYNVTAVNIVREDTFRDTWTLDAGFRVAWRPTPFLGIETAFYLYYSWSEYERLERDLHRDLEPPLESDRVELLQIRDSERRFHHDGWNGLGDLVFVVWF